MAILSKVLFNNSSRTIIKLVNTSGAPASTTITLESLVATGQTVQGTPKVSIINAVSSLDNNGMINVIRNSEVALKLFGVTEFMFSTDLGCVINENSTSDVVVEFSHDGTLIIEFRKEKGYSFGADLATIGI